MGSLSWYAEFNCSMSASSLRLRTPLKQGLRLVCDPRWLVISAGDSTVWQGHRPSPALVPSLFAGSHTELPWPSKTPWVPLCAFCLECPNLLTSQMPPFHLLCPYGPLPHSSPCPTPTDLPIRRDLQGLGLQEASANMQSN